MILIDLIKKAESGNAPRTHDVRGAASSLAFLRTYSISKVLDGGQWASSGAFILRYLSHTITDNDCVALGFYPWGEFSPASLFFP